MADLGLYDVEINGYRTQMQLTEDDAEALYPDNAKKVGSVDVAEPVPVHHGAQAASEDEKKAPAPANKSRSAVGK